MSMENLGPYSNFHELNQDWFLNEFNKVIAQWKDMQKNFDSLEDAFYDLKSYVQNYFKNLDVQEEINNKLDDMAKNGELDEIFTLFVPYVTPEQFGAKGDGVTDDSNAFKKALESKKPVIARATKYKIASTVVIPSNTNLSVYGEIISNNNTVFQIGSDNFQSDYSKIYIFKGSGTGINNNDILIDIYKGTYNNIKIHHATNFNTVVRISSHGSCGENIIYPTLWYINMIGLHIEGGTSWEESNWCEGTQLLGGFIAKSFYGIKIERNVKYSGMLITTAIDNKEVEGSYDYYNDGNEAPTYQISNLLLFRFIRYSRCVFKNIDCIFDPNTGIFTNGRIKCTANITSEVNKNNFGYLYGDMLQLTGNNPLVNFNNGSEEDYIFRIGYVNNQGFVGLKNKSAFYFDDDIINVIASKLKTTASINSGEILANGSIISTYNNIRSYIYNGLLQLSSSNNIPRINLNDNTEIDYVGRISLMNKKLHLSLKSGDKLVCDENGVNLPNRCGVLTVSPNKTAIDINPTGLTSDEYVVIVTTSWNCNAWVSNKNTNGFTVMFSDNTTGGTLNWLILSV